MKRKILSLTAIVLAISLSAFTVRSTGAKLPQYYWFPLDGWGSPVSVPKLVYQSFDPYLCTNWALGDYCAGAFTSYYGSSGAYFAQGVEVVIHYHLFL